MCSVDQPDGVVVSFILFAFFDVDPAVDVLVMKHEDDKLLVKLDHFFSGRASHVDVFELFGVDVVVVVLEQQFEGVVHVFVVFKEV